MQKRFRNDSLLNASCAIGKRSSEAKGKRMAHRLRLKSLNHQTHCRQVKFLIRLVTIEGFSERGAGKEGGRDGQRVVARNPGDGLRRASPGCPAPMPSKSHRLTRRERSC